MEKAAQSCWDCYDLMYIWGVVKLHVCLSVCLVPSDKVKKLCQQLHVPQPSLSTVFSVSEPHPVHYYFDYSTP